MEASTAPNDNCPNCGEHIGTPGMFHGDGTSGMAMHTHRECENCGRPLIWFSDSEALPPGWRIDDAEERQRKRRQE
jgi:endogenous inhibitor of DNA gyrase (YacG/DUF329 family)